jgi:hypothetical protein
MAVQLQTVERQHLELDELRKQLHRVRGCLFHKFGLLFLTPFVLVGLGKWFGLRKLPNAVSGVVKPYMGILVRQLTSVVHSPEYVSGFSGLACPTAACAQSWTFMSDAYLPQLGHALFLLSYSQYRHRPRRGIAS